MLKFILGLSVWLFAVAGYLYFYDEQPQIALIVGIALLVLFVGFTIEKSQK